MKKIQKKNINNFFNFIIEKKFIYVNNIFINNELIKNI